MKLKQTIKTEKAPKAIGPYSQGIIFENLIFTSGQIGINAEGELVGKDIVEQTEQVIKNLKEVLKAGGSGLSSVIKTTVFLKNMSDFSAMNEVYEKYFTEKPARSTVEVSALPKGALVEIDCIAEIER